MKKPLGMKKETRTRTSQRRTLGPHQLESTHVYVLIMWRTGEEMQRTYPFWMAARLSRVSFTPTKARLRIRWRRESAKQMRWTYSRFRPLANQKFERIRTARTP